MLTTVIIPLIVLGILMYLVNTYIPMEARIKSILNIVVIVIVVLWLLQTFGLLGPLNRIWLR